MENRECCFSLARKIYIFFKSILNIYRASGDLVYYSQYKAFLAPALPAGPREGTKLLGNYLVSFWRAREKNINFIVLILYHLINLKYSKQLNIDLNTNH